MLTTEILVKFERVSLLISENVVKVHRKCLLPETLSGFEADMTESALQCCI